MKGFLYQILGDATEELYWSDSPIDYDVLLNFWNEYRETVYDDFETYMEEIHPSITLERVFVEYEVNV